MKIVLSISFVLVACLAVSGQINPVCPKIEVKGPAEAVSPNDIMIFKASADRSLMLDSEFEWTVSAGTIEAGQGTSTIKVRVPTGGLDKVEASVKVVGPSTRCDEIFTAEAAVRPVLACGLAPDNYPKLNRNDERVRLASAAHMLSMNPNEVLVFVLYLSPNETATDAKKRETFIRNFFERDKLVASGPLYVPVDRLLLAFAGDEETHTAVYLIPPTDVASFVKTFKASTNIEDLRPVK
jgi:hypothetical protein